jgi:hypothetical protein
MDVQLISTYAQKKPKKPSEKCIKSNEKEAMRLFGLDVSQNKANKDGYKLKGFAEDR